MIVRLDACRLRRGAALWLLPGLACALLAACPGRAEDDVVAEEPPADVQQKGGVLDAKQAAAARQTLVATYENTVYQHHAMIRRLGRAHPARTERPAPREWMERFVALWIGRIEASCELTEPQRGRLAEVLRIELKPVVAQIEADLARYNALRLEGRDSAFQHANQSIPEDAFRVRCMLFQAVAEDSLFFKVLSTTLTEEQHECLMTDLAASRAGRWAAAVACTLDTLDAMLGLSTKQHDGLEKLLLERQPMLSIYPPQAESGHAWFALVTIELARIEDHVLEDIFNKRQMVALKVLQRNAEAMRPHYERQGWYEP